MITQSQLQNQLNNCLIEAQFEEWQELYKKGKVRDMYLLPNKRILITTDRQSAFDHVLGSIPLKGQVLTAWPSIGLNNVAILHLNMIIEVPDGNVTIAQELKILPIEVVVRKYLTGSSDTAIWTHYEKGVRDYCGHCLAKAW